MVLARRVVAACALLLFSAGPAVFSAQAQQLDLVVYYPLDFTLVEKADLPVEGYVRSADVDAVEVAVNGGRPRQVRLHQRLFIEEVSLDEGFNTVRIGTLERRVWLASAAANPPAGYRRIYGHIGLNDGCLECHKTDAAGTFTLAGEREEICGWCHGDLTRGRRGVPWTSVHAPVRAGACLTCHSPHLSAAKGLPAENAPGCAGCHAAVTERLKTDRFIHGPMSLGDCRLCHAVHASTEPKLLVRPATALCTDCHSDALPPAGTPAALQPHPMIPEGQCGRCHEPHSSENQRLLRQPAGRLCQGCHEGKTRSFHEAKGFSIYVCSKCHDLHRPSQPHLIMDTSRSLCTTCHDFRAAAVFTHSFVAEGRCFLCHSFHEVSLERDVASLCLGCHRDNPRLPEAHRGIAIGSARCTGCHQPHQANRDKLLRSQEHTPFKNRSCELCHRDRAAKLGPTLAPLCVDCHRNKVADASAASMHPPFRDGDCSGCHRSHNADAENLLKEPEGQLCLECHRKMRKAMLLTPVSSHAAVREGRCGACHDPHFSPNPTLLRTSQEEWCASCHAALVLAPGGGPWANRHKPVEERKCRLCHRSHTSNNPDLLKSPLPQPCRPCHAVFFAAAEAPGVASLHQPVREGACAVCHDLHGSAAARLLKAGARGATCRGCHAKLNGSHHRLSAEELQAGGGGAPLESSDCAYCHLPHVSAQKKLLLPLGSVVCLGCHKA